LDYIVYAIGITCKIQYQLFGELLLFMSLQKGT